VHKLKDSINIKYRDYSYESTYNLINIVDIYIVTKNPGYYYANTLQELNVIQLLNYHQLEYANIPEFQDILTNYVNLLTNDKRLGELYKYRIYFPILTGSDSNFRLACNHYIKIFDTKEFEGVFTDKYYTDFIGDYFENLFEDLEIYQLYTLYLIILIHSHTINFSELDKSFDLYTRYHETDDLEFYIIVYEIKKHITSHKPKVPVNTTVLPHVTAPTLLILPTFYLPPTTNPLL
jgi:hypothetical protein